MIWLFFNNCSISSFCGILLKVSVIISFNSSFAPETESRVVNTFEERASFKSITIFLIISSSSSKFSIFEAISLKFSDESEGFIFCAKVLIWEYNSVILLSKSSASGTLSISSATLPNICLISSVWERISSVWSWIWEKSSFDTFITALWLSLSIASWISSISSFWALELIFSSISLALSKMESIIPFISFRSSLVETFSRTFSKFTSLSSIDCRLAIISFTAL